VIRSPNSISRLRAAWVVQATVGWVVTASRCTRRLSSSMMNKT
jgi:hypothetical protein